MNLSKQFDLKLVLIIVLTAIILFKHCGNTTSGDKEIINVDGKKYELLKHTVDTVWNEKIVEIPKYIPKYIEKLVEVPVTIPTEIDSLAVIQEYFSTNRVIDTIYLKYNFTDSNSTKLNSNLGFGVITDVISQNAIQSRDVIWNYTIPTIYDTKIVKEIPRNQLYWGINSGFSRQVVISNLNTSLILKTKNDKMYQLGVGVQNDLNSNMIPVVYGGLYWKILGK